MTRRILSSLLLLLFLALPALAAEKIRWIHVRVQEGGVDGESVHVNVPLSLVDGVLTLLEEKQRDATFRFDDSEIDRVELQRILTQLREAPEEAEILLEKGGDRVWFSRSGDRLLIRVDEERSHHAERSRGAETRILIPMKLADALVASPEMDLKSVIRSFEGDGEILVVDGEDDTTVRVWIDEKSRSE